MKWYLDVDGVINIVNHPSVPEWAEVPWPHEELRLATVRGFKIRWHSDVVATINDFAAHPDHEVVWLTTWQDYANTDLIEPLGINGPFRVLHNGNKMSDYTWWKGRALAADIEGSDEPYIWTDDDLDFSRKLEQHVHYIVNAAPSGSVLVSPKTNTGLTPESLRAIREAADLPTERAA